MKKEIKGEKYIYLNMGYKLASMQTPKRIRIGYDNGLTGGQNFTRYFTIQKYQGKTILNEIKTSKHFADFTKSFEVLETPTRVKIYEYITKDGENASKNWVH